MISQARQERGAGVPLNDVERACRHYGITQDEYFNCPRCYPLPDRGTGLTGISQEYKNDLWPLVVFFGLSTLVIGAILKRKS